MYAIFEDGGKQYKVSTGDKVLLERRDLQEGQTELTLDKVLMVGEGAESRVGTPWVEGATISAKIVQELKLLKVTGVKFRRRKGSMVRWGHRQKALKVEISAINA
ncbi:MAG: 50S ribosomal protein L21 [Phycisphaerae bacterium]